MMPECERPLEQTIRRSLPHWNLSVEQWPFYLSRKFGIDDVTHAIDCIAETEGLNDIEQRAVHTLRYWLQAKRDTIIGTLTPE